MQQKNLIAFIVLTVVILVGWQALARRLWPPPQRTQDPWATLSEQAQREALARLSLVGAPRGDGFGNAAGLVTHAVVTDLWARDKLPSTQDRWEALSPAARREALARLALVAAPRGDGLGSVPGFATQAVVTDLWARNQLPREVQKKPKSRDDIELGGEGFNLTVRFTTHGAAVYQLVLNKFEAANDYGKPAAGNPPPRLQLIQDQLDNPSNLLYHYSQPDDPNPEAALGTCEWKLASLNNRGNQEHEVVFTTDVPGMDVRITKTFTLEPGAYHLGLALKFERKGAGQEPLKFRYQLTGAHGLPIEGIWYTSTYRNAVVGRVKGETDVSRDLQTAQDIGFKAGGDAVRRDEQFWIQYAGIVNQYFGSVIAVEGGYRVDNGKEVPINKKDVIAWARPTVVDEPVPDKQFLDDITMRVIAEPVELQPGKPVVHRYVLYNGPVKVHLLTHLESGADESALIGRYETEFHLNTLTDSKSPGTPGFFENIGWTGLLIRCTNLMHGVLWYLHHVIPQYGICIIVLTLLVRGIMFPLSRRQSLASAKMQAKMAELAPEVKKLEDKFTNDPTGLQQAKTELYLKRGIHPLAMMGSCWVLFLQMPIFLGLYYALQESIHFRLAPFLWMRNLAAPDMLFYWGESIPWISRPQDLHSSWIYLGPFFNLLPIVAIAFMIVQQKMLAPPPTDEQAAMQQKMMKYMSILMGFIFYKFASGLCIYFIVSSAWGLMERKLLPKKTAPGVAAGKAAGPAPTASRRAKARTKKGKDQGNGKFQKVKNFWEKVLKEAKKK